ncbi:MAG: hypothetical protein K2L88_03865 [Clostridiales bacterium]|nr:hypothetical protein [Clostridiales bacterium]
MRCSRGGIEKPLSAFGKCDTCRGVTEAYRLYRYNLFKEKYQNYGRQK